MNETNAPLRVFLCYSSIDKLLVRKLYQNLKRRGIRPWFAEEDLVLGTNWEEEIQSEIAASDLIIICLTKNSINKEGYFQKEIRFALDRAKEMPERQIFIIPVKLEVCEIPHELTSYHYWDLSAEKDYSKLLKSLKLRASQLGRTPVKLSATASKEDKLLQEGSISKGRVLEAAIQSQVFVGKPASLFVWVRRHGSKNIISVVKSANEDVQLDEKGVKTNELEVEFPIKNGQTLPAEITLRLDAPEFEPSPQEKNIYIPPKGDSTVCRFVVTPKRTGELLLNLEVLKGKFSVGSTDVWTTAIDQEMKVDDKVVLMVIPIFVLVQPPPTIADVKPIGQKEDNAGEIPVKVGTGGKVSSNEKQPTSTQAWGPILRFLGVVLAAFITGYISYRGIVSAVEIPIKATQTAEVELLTRTAQVVADTDTPQPTVTNIPTITSTPTFTPTQFICPYEGQTDNQTVVNLIQAEATAVNTKNLDIIMAIFDPNAFFIDYASNPLKHWLGPRERYENDLFQNIDFFQNVEHFDILPAGPGIDGDTAYYTSGSRGQYRGIGEREWKKFNNGSSLTTQYGSDHWILRKNEKGCWVISRMEFDAGLKQFP